MSETWAPGQMVSRYTLIRRLGAGGMGEVFLASDPMLQRQVAVKVLFEAPHGDPAALERLLHEARSAAAIDHPFVCKVYEVGETNGRGFLAMEFVEGDTLHGRLARHRVSVSEAVQIAIETGEALMHAHARGVIHRDLKPANIMMTPDGHVKVMDFGVAKRLSSPDTKTAWPAARTAVSEVVGTLEYMSPEQLRGEPSDPRSDIFALGLILHQMLTGRHPFGKPSSVATAAAILHETPPPLSDWTEVPDALAQIVPRMLAKDRNDRYATAEEVRAALMPLLREGGPSSSFAVRRPASRRLAAPVAAAALVAATAAAIWVFTMRGGNEGGSLAGVTSLVAMPATVAGAEVDAFLTDAIPNTLSNHLLGVTALETKRPPTNIELERAGGDVERFARIYGVNAYLMSSVTASGDALTLNVQMTDATSRRLLWSGDFRGTRARYTDLVRDAAEGVRRAIRPADAPLVTTTAPSDAELALQRGLHYFQLYKTRGRPVDRERSASALQEALTLDANESRAAVGLALLYNAADLTGQGTEATRQQAEQWARKAISIDPRASTAWAVLSELERVRASGTYVARLEYALKSASLGPRDGFAQSRLASALMVNAYALGLPAAQEATRADPLLPDGPLAEAVALMGIGQNDGAIAKINEALAIQPDMLYAIFTKGIILNRAGKTDEAARIVQELTPMAAAGQINPQLVRLLRELMAFQGAAAQGNHAEMQRTAAILDDMARGKTPFPRWEIITQGVSRAFEMNGMRDAALDLMAFRAARRLIDPFDYLMGDRGFARLHGDPRFAAILGASRSRFEEMTTLLDSAAGRGELPEYLGAPLQKLRSRLQSAAPPR